MRLALFILLIGLALFGCTKEQEIEFIPSETDTILPTAFIEIGGTYRGKIARIEFIDTIPNVISFTIFPPERSLDVLVTDLDFATVNLDRITAGVDNGTSSFVQRIKTSSDEDLAYLKFNLTSLDSNYFPKYIYAVDYGSYIDSFNGRWTASDSNLHYFLQELNGSDTTDYFFSGTKL